MRKEGYHFRTPIHVLSADTFTIVREACATDVCLFNYVNSDLHLVSVAYEIPMQVVYY
jgi:hypothetical protein